MPRKISTDSTEVDTSPETSIEEKLDQILVYLHHMDRRDRLRTIGGFVKGMLALIPLVLLLWSTWYFIEHGPELMSEITKQAVQQSAEYSRGSLMEQFEQYMNGGQ